MKTGSTVRLIQPVIEGQVMKRQITDDDQELLLVQWVTGEEKHQRWFKPSELEEVPAAEEPAAPGADQASAEVKP